MSKYEKIGVIGAMDVEIEGVMAAMSAPSVRGIGGSRFVTGAIGGTEVPAVPSGIGKVNAAFAACVLALQFGAGSIIMTGVCGGAGLNALDALVPDGFVQHDVDILGEERGYIDILGTTVIRPDAVLSDELAAASGAKRGLMATGEGFVSGEEQVRGILSRFPLVRGMDMESAAAAQVCARLGVPFACVKIVSDGGSDDTYFDFKTAAAEKSVSAVLHLLGK